MPTPQLARLALIYMVSAFVAGCQPPKAVAPFGLDPARLPAMTTTSDMTLVNGETRMPLGTARSEMTPVELGGRDAIRFALTQELRQGTMYDTLWTDAATLLPIRYVNSFADIQSIEVNYGADGRVQSEVVRGVDVTRKDTLLVGPHFDLAEFTMLIPALPLADGYSAELPAFHYLDGATTIGVRVDTADVVEHRGETRPVWMVELTSGGSTSRHAVDKQTRVVLRVETEISPGRVFEQTMVDGLPVIATEA